MSKGELTVEAASGTGAVDSKGLKGGALGLVSSIVVGMASTAPAYSLAASLGLVVAAGGVLQRHVKLGRPGRARRAAESAVGREGDAVW